MRSILCFLAATAAAHAGFDVTQPARVRIKVVDEAGSPIEAVAVTFEATEWPRPAVTERKSTDARGFADFAPRASPAWGGTSRTSWRAQVDIAKEGYVLAYPEHGLGYLSRPSTLQLFPAAELEETIVLEKAATTLIRFLAPDGSPVPHVRFRVSDDTFMADERGEFRFQHSRFLTRLGVELAGPSFVGGPGRMFRAHALQEGPVFEFRMTPYQVANVERGRWVEGRALLADGSPAAGWILATQVWSPISERPRPRDLLPGGVMPTWQRRDQLVSRAQTLLPADGSFGFFAHGDTIVLVSPEGVPFRFPLTPQLWPPGIRRITLLVPPQSGTFDGRLRYAGEQPAAGLKLEVTSAVPRSPENAWRFQFGPDSGPLTPERSQLVSDATGRFVAPIYAGIEISWAGQNTTATESLNVANPVVTVDDPKPPAPANLKHVLLVLQDERGNPIPQYEDAIRRYHTASPPGVRDGPSWHTDRRGTHLFLPAEATSFLLRAGTVSGNNSNPVAMLRKTIDIGPSDDEIVRVTVLDAERMSPLRGIVLDPDGKPVAGMYVEATGPNGPGWGTVRTGADGRFQFDHAPIADGILDVRGDPFDLRMSDRPAGYPLATPTPSFSARERDITIRLTRFGAVRVRIPTGIPLIPYQAAWLARIGGPSSWLSRVSMTYDPSTHTLWTRMPPGNYSLVNGVERTFAGIENTSVTVEGGRETLIDLSDPGYLAPPAPDPAAAVRKVDITVMLDGKPFSGATVLLVPDQMNRWADGDISDESGRVRLAENPESQRGRRTVIARVPGKWAGQAAFEFGASQPVVIQLEKEPGGP